MRACQTVKQIMTVAHIIATTYNNDLKQVVRFSRGPSILEDFIASAHVFPMSVNHSNDAKNIQRNTLTNDLNLKTPDP